MAISRLGGGKTGFVDRIRMAEVGAPLDEIREDKVLVNPDISYLRLAE